MHSFCKQMHGYNNPCAISFRHSFLLNHALDFYHTLIIMMPNLELGYLVLSESK